MDFSFETLYSEEEYNRDLVPYRLYMKAIEDVFSFTSIDSFADLGCNNGQLLNSIRAKYPKLKIWGCDYFPWAKKYADKRIKDFIEICDLSNPISITQTFDIVNCTEVGEHISAKSEDTLINNLVKISGDILILSWSNEKQDQHLNPHPKSYIIEKLASKDFIFWKDAADTLEEKLRNLVIFGAHYWWADNIMVFKRVKHLNVHQSYLMQGVYTDNSSHQVEFVDGRGFSLQKSYMELIETIRKMIAVKKSFSILRASDGDFYFLEAISTGSAMPGKRALTRNYDYDFSLLFKRLFWHNDLIAIETNKNLTKLWIDYLFLQPLFFLCKKFRIPLQGKTRSFFWNSIRKLRPLLLALNIPKVLMPIMKRKYGKNCKNSLEAIFQESFVPSECIYALVSSKWIFKEFPDSIGIIGSSEKLELIKKLMQHKEYKSYLGVNKFTDYIQVPQIGAADDIINLSKEIGIKVKNSKAKIFLVGVGSAKIGLLPLLKSYSDAVFIDVGCGIDAIAGVVCQDRPFFADWINYKIKGYPYETIDFMDQGNPKWNNSSYRVIELH